MRSESIVQNAKRHRRPANSHGMFCECAHCGILTLIFALTAAYGLMPIARATAATQPAAPAIPLPVVTVTAPHVAIDHSCRIVIPLGTILDDSDGTGAIRVTASNVEIEFAATSVLRGSAADRQPDQYTGYGLRLDGVRNVTIRNARVSGYRAGIWASRADGLSLSGIDASDNRRAQLRSTAGAEDGADWLYPHDNENYNWLKTYGAAIYIDQSRSLDVHDCLVTHGQNGLVLDRVSESKVFDNDFSFNSGWGIALWRSSDNVISRNAVDFCVRGYSHGVYNRGEDSAGILMFEQNCRNVIVENSATQGGDCFFGYAGREALGEGAQHSPEWFKRRGNNDNLLIGNDFSYAAAHGIEMTFSFGNRFIANRLVDNAICGIWGGYSQDTLIEANDFEGNGGMGYGLERGGVNIEHGRNNRVVGNKFRDNKCGVHLWYSPNAELAKKPWGMANGDESTQNLIAGNELDGDAVAFQFRGASDVTLSHNTLKNVKEELIAEPAVKIAREDGAMQDPTARRHPIYGQRHPVGGRPTLHGRQNIIMTEWGPWDHASPLARQRFPSDGGETFELLKLPADVKVSCTGDGMSAKLTPARADVQTCSVLADSPGVRSYTLDIDATGYHKRFTGVVVGAAWHAKFFECPKSLDPRQHLAEWRQLAAGANAVSVDLPRLKLDFGGSGPSALHLSKPLDQAKINGGSFGMIATASLSIPKGAWQLKTISDDGVRVIADGKPLIEDWRWHGATTDTAVLTLVEARTVEFTIEYFQIDGSAVMEFEISPAK